MDAPVPPQIIPPVIAAATPAGEARLRFVRTTRLNGLSIALVAGLSIPFACWSGDLTAAVLSALATACGIAEHLAGRRLSRGGAGGTWLAPAAEVALFFVIALYAAGRLHSFDPAAMLRLLPGFIHELAAAARLPDHELERIVRLSNSLTCALIVIITLGYQGGMALYYQRLRRRIGAETPEEAGVTPPESGAP